MMPNLMSSKNESCAIFENTEKHSDAAFPSKHTGRRKIEESRSLFSEEAMFHFTPSFSFCTNIYFSIVVYYLNIALQRRHEPFRNFRK